jgi:hypothetical protein
MVAVGSLVIHTQPSYANVVRNGNPTIRPQGKKNNIAVSSSEAESGKNQDINQTYSPSKSSSQRLHRKTPVPAQTQLSYHVKPDEQHSHLPAKPERESKMVKNKSSVETQTEDTVRRLPAPSQGYTAEILRDMLFEACSYKISPLAPNKGYTAEIL